MSNDLMDSANGEVHFNFDKSFQEKIVQSMIYDRPWAAQFVEVLNVNYFQYDYLKLLSDRYISYHKQFKEFPSQELLRTIVVDDLKSDKDMVLRQQVQNFLVKVAKNENLGDLPFVKEKSLDFCRRKGLEIALEKSVGLIATDNYDKVVTTIKEALAAGMATSPGLSLEDDIAARYVETSRNAIKTGIPDLDSRKILNGGLGNGEIGTIVAPSGQGKSHLLTQFGAEALKQGKNVLHYSFELRERIVGIRYDSYLCEIPSLDCIDNIEKIKSHYEENKTKYGRLIIKEFPTRTATTVTLRNHVERLGLTGFRPDIILVDYSGIMRSTEKYDLPRLELQRIFEELRGLAQELDIPIWTATQSNKEGSNAEFIDMTNMAESYGQSHACDVILGFLRKAELKSTGFGTLYVAKNRAGMDGIQYKVHLDTAQSRLRVLTDKEVEEYMPSLNNGGEEKSFNPVSSLKNLYKKQQEQQTQKKLKEFGGISLERMM